MFEHEKSVKILEAKKGEISKSETVISPNDLCLILISLFNPEITACIVKGQFHSKELCQQHLPFLLAIRYAFRALTSLPVLRTGKAASKPAHEALAETKSSTNSLLFNNLQVQCVVSEKEQGKILNTVLVVA